MLSIDKQPDTIKPNFLSKCLEWHIQDNDFIASPGINAVVVFFLNGAYAPPFTNGAEFVILGETIVVDNNLSTGEYVGLCVSGNGTQTEFTQTVVDALSNHFIDTLTIATSSTIFTVTFNEVGVQGNFINDNDNTVYTAGVSNGIDPVYTNSRIKVQLWEVDGTQPIARQEQDVRIGSDGSTKVNIFNFLKEIRLRLNSYPPNFNDIPVLVIGQQEFYIRYAVLVPDVNNNYISKGYQQSDRILVLNAVQQSDDNRGTDRFANFNIEPLNQYPKKCLNDNFAWLYYSLNLNFFFGGLGFEFDYKMEVQATGIPTFEAPIGSEDGILQHPYGDANAALLGSPLPENSVIGLQIQADVKINGAPNGDITVSVPFSFNTGRSCLDREIYWLEQTGAYSTLCFSYEESRGIQTEGEKTCIGKPCGMGYVDELKTGHYRSYIKKSKKQAKLKLEKTHTLDNQEALFMFLAADEYYVRDIDREGNDIMRKILLNYGQSSLYKKGDLLELIIGYEYSTDIKTQSNV